MSATCAIAVSRSFGICFVVCENSCWKTVEWPVIWHAIALMWRHCDNGQKVSTRQGDAAHSACRFWCTVLHWSHQPARGVAIYGVCFRTTSAQISWNLVLKLCLSHLLNRFDISHRARQSHCRVLCELSKGFDNYANGYRPARFCEILITDWFLADLPYCTSLTPETIIMTLSIIIRERY